MSIIAYVIIAIVSLVIVLLGLWVADAVAHKAATKMSANKDDNTVYIRRWSFWGSRVITTTSKELWYGAVYNVTLNVVFKLVVWVFTNALNTGINVVNRSKAGAY